jgi:alpha-tubulin suppressor-like RCC1 family protein
MRSWLLAFGLLSACAVEDPTDAPAPVACAEGGKCDSPTTTNNHLLAAQIAAGHDHNCAILADGNVRCWGLNGTGEVGDRSQPRGDGSWGSISVAKFPGPLSMVAANGSTSCGYVVTSGLLDSRLTAPDDGTVTPVTGSRTDSGVYCWGSMLGLPVLEPIRDDGQPQLLLVGGMHYAAGLASPLAGPALTAMTLGLNQVCVANGAGVACHGIIEGEIQSKTYASLSKLVTHEVCESDGNTTLCVSQLEPEIHIAQLVSGTLHTCALSTDGRAWCWGDNSSGELGDGTKTNASEPVAVKVPGGASVKAIAAGDRFTCVMTDTDVYCIGRNAYGANGSGTHDLEVSTFQRVQLPSAPTKLAAFFERACAIVEGDVYCWGHAFGTDFDWTPSKVEGLATPATALEVGREHACINTEQGVQCWGGLNDYGQLGTHESLPIGAPKWVRATPGYP